MEIHDRIYGTFDVTEPVLLDLIASPSMQRLKGINQLGMPDEYYFVNGFSRFEHCVGVMLLLRKLGATLEEQIAGLLHDVSHTAFSHVADWVLGSHYNEDFQDSQHERFIFGSELPEIIQRHGFHAQNLVDYHQFGLLERDAPDLCADRVDYALREIPAEHLKSCLQGLATRNGFIVYKNEADAAVFARDYVSLNETHWASFQSMSRYKILAAILKRGIDIGVIHFDDLWKTDGEVINVLCSSSDAFIIHWLAVLRNKDLSALPKENEPTVKKFRHVDPLVIVGDKSERLSTLNSDFKIELEAARARSKEGLHVVAITG